jgi:hypothetical protein
MDEVQDGQNHMYTLKVLFVHMMILNLRAGKSIGGYSLPVKYGSVQGVRGNIRDHYDTFTMNLRK